jgi:GDPmannose 4,6-dehydratase
MRKALITGVAGQDGSYLAELLLNHGYHVMGVVRGPRNGASSQSDTSPVPKAVEVVESNLVEDGSVERLLRRFHPNEVYNLAARASSSELWAEPVSTGELNALLVVRLLDAIHRVDPLVRFVQASSSELFGSTAEVPQSESTAFQPRNPYGVAKAFGHWMTAVYREQRGLFSCACILYNHESPRRGQEFVTRKISRGAAMIKLGLANELRLGDLNARRDWGFAGDYVKAMWLSLQHSTPGDYIVATGETHSVREFCEIAFAHLGLRYENYVVEDRENFRPPETALLVGNPAKAKRLLGWNPTVDFEQLVKMMVDGDLQSLAVSGARPDPEPDRLNIVPNSAPTKRTKTDEDLD